MSLLPQPVQNFLPPDAQERPDQVPPHRLHAAQAPQSGSPEQMEKHSLRLIVHMMGHGDARAAKPFRLLPEGLVPAETARFLQGPPFPGRPLPHVKGKDAQRDLLPGAELPHKGFVPVGLRPAQAVVHVEGFQGKIPGRREPSKHAQKAGRVGASGNRRHYVPAPLYHMLSLYGFSHFPLKIHLYGHPLSLL